MFLTEDAIYRRSTQFRHWSFSSAQLADRRRRTNIQASERVSAAVAQCHIQRNQVDTATSSTSVKESDSSFADEPSASTSESEIEVDCLTVAEEDRLVDIFSEKALALGNFLEFPIHVTATGIQYLRRFYLFNSPMTYDPRTIVQTTMFMANKVERHSLSAGEYSARVDATVSTILASEYVILQSLRFHLEVKHPFLGLKGGHLELVAMAHGNASPIASCEQTPAEIQQAMLFLPLSTDSPATDMTVSELEKRILHAYVFASHTLKTTALLTDAYFLYTPSHIWFSAHLLADEPLTLFYLSTKLRVTSSIYAKTLATIRSCASLLASHSTFTHKDTSKEEKEAREKRTAEDYKALLGKLKQCKEQMKLISVS